MLASLALGLVLQGAPFDFYSHGPYRPEVPRPESLLGYGPGERHTPYRDLERVVLAIAQNAGDRVKVIEFGSSTEGRPLRLLAISSPKNIARLEELREANARLASGTGDRDATVRDNPTFVWINEGIHGNETASFESGMWLLYSLAASNEPTTLKTLDDAVVLLNPAYNPDGHERFVVWYNSVATGSPLDEAFELQEPSVLSGRTNHYRFDLNRDRISFSQQETRQEVAEFLRWNPQVYVDQHGQTRTYFFPPNPMSVNAGTDRARIEKWTDIFGRATAGAFDANRWEYNIRDSFDLYYAGYLDSWTSLAGAIGMTHETDGSNTRAMEREDGTLWTFREGIAKHFTAARTLVASAAQHRADLLRSFADFKSNIVSGKALGGMKRVVVESEDPRPLVRLAEQLRRSGIVSRFVGAAFEQPDAHDYWSSAVGKHTVPKGSLVIDLQQPQGAVAKALLEPGSDFEEAFTKEQIRRREAAKGDERYPGEGDPEFYDTTAWCLVYGHGLAARWSGSTPTFEGAEEPPAVANPVQDSPIGWALEYRDQDDVLEAARLLRAGVRVQMSEEPMRLDGRTYGRGTFLVLRSRNDDLVYAKVGARPLTVGKQKHHLPEWIALKSGYPDEGRHALGSSGVRSLRTPQIGIVFGDRESTTGFGPLWYLMEREFELPFTGLATSALAGDLSRYTCLVFPRGRTTLTPKLREWIQAGGTAVVMGSPNWIGGEKGLVELKANGVADLPGALFRAQMDDRLPIAFGYDGKHMAIPVAGSTFYEVQKTGGAVVSIPTKGKPLSGWFWPDETEDDVAGTVWVHDEPIGRGRVVIFVQDPAERAMWPGLYKLLLNAMLF